MTLEFLPPNQYNKSMKQLKHIIFILICVLTVAPLYAQSELAKQLERELWGKGIKETIQTEKGLFAWPKNLSTLIRETVSANTFGATELTPLSEAMAASMPEIFFIQDTVESKTLFVLKEEADFYQPEIDAGRQLRMDLLKVETLSEPAKAELQKSVAALHSNTLEGLLTSHLQTGDLQAFYQDLTEYYALDGDEVNTAYNYLLRHPHKPTLWVRRMLRNPLVDRRLQKQVTKFLSYNHIAAEDQPLLLTTLQRIQQQAEHRVNQARTSDIIRARHQFITDTKNDLEKFIAQKGIRPNRNTLDPMELDLAKKIDWVLAVMPSMASFEPLASDLAALKKVWQENAPKHLSYEETIAQAKDFVKQTGYLPRPLREAADQSAEEIELYNNIQYWLFTKPNSSNEFFLLKKQ